MKLQKIFKNEYDNSIIEFNQPFQEKYVSPSGEFELELKYAGEFLRGDFYYNCEIRNVINNNILFQYNGRQMAMIYVYPWTADNKNLYFTLIDQGNRITKFDLDSCSFQILFESKVNENRLNYIHFIPESLNGVLIMSQSWFENKEIKEYYLYVKNESKLQLLNNFFGNNFYPLPSSIKNCIYIFDSENITLFDVIEKEIIKQEKHGLALDKYSPLRRPFINKNLGEIYFVMTYESDSQYIKLIEHQ